MEAIATIKAIQSGWVHPTINHVRGHAAAGVPLSVRALLPASFYMRASASRVQVA